jgi:hypothetical protein
MDARSAGGLIVVAGIGLVVVGLFVYSGALSWFGRLPGDFSYEGERTRVYIPFASMILVSVVLSVVLYLVRRFL